MIVDDPIGNALGSGPIEFSNASSTGTLKYGPNFGSSLGSSSIPDLSARFTNTSDQVFRISNPSGLDVKYSSPFGSAGASLVKSGTGKLTLNASADNNFPNGVIFSGGELVIDSSTNAFGTTGPLTFNGGTLVYGSSLADPLPDLSSLFDSSTSSQAIRVSIPAGKSVTFASPLQSTGGSLTKLGAGTLTLSSATNSYDGATSVQEGVLRLTEIGDQLL